MEKSSNRLKSTMNLGLVLGVVLLMLHLLSWFLNPDGVRYGNLLNYAAVAICLSIGTKSYRDKEMNGMITYSQALGYGSLTGFFSSVVYALYFYLFITIIDPEFIERALLLTEESLYYGGSNEDEIDIIMSFREALRSPVLWSISAVITFTFIGFIISLVTSIFVKKEKYPFNNNQTELK